MGIKDFNHLKKSLSDIESNTKILKQIEKDISKLNREIQPYRIEIEGVRAQFEPAEKEKRKAKIAKLESRLEAEDSELQAASLGLFKEEVRAKQAIRESNRNFRIIGFGLGIIWIYALLNFRDFYSGLGLTSPGLETSCGTDFVFCLAWIAIPFLFLSSGGGIIVSLAGSDPNSQVRPIGTIENEKSEAKNLILNMKEGIIDELNRTKYYKGTHIKDHLPAKLKSLEQELNHLEILLEGKLIDKSKKNAESEALWEGIKHLLPHSHLLGPG